MSRGLGKIERAIEKAIWEDARWREQPGYASSCMEVRALARAVYNLGSPYRGEHAQVTRAQSVAVRRAMRSLAGKSPCFEVLRDGDGLYIQYHERSEVVKKRRGPGAGRKPWTPEQHAALAAKRKAFDDRLAWVMDKMLMR